jgi:hypothetical protein
MRHPCKRSRLRLLGSSDWPGADKLAAATTICRLLGDQYAATKNSILIIMMQTVSELAAAQGI